MFDTVVDMIGKNAAKMLFVWCVAVGAVGGLAGCEGAVPIVTETPTPTAMPSETPAPSVSASPSPSPSASGTSAPLSDEELLELLPDGAERTDLVGAIKTAEYFIQEFPRMMASGETDVWDSLSLTGCEFCESSRENALKVQADEWKVRGGEITQGDGITEANLQDDLSVIVKYPIMAADVYVAEPGSDERLATEQSSSAMYVQMERVGEVWRVLEVGSEE